MGLIHADSQIILDKRYVKALAIVGHNDLIPGDILSEIVKVFAVHIIIKIPAASSGVFRVRTT